MNEFENIPESENIPERQKIIQNPKVFSLDYFPDQFMYREEHKEIIKNCFLKFLKGDKVLLLIFGLPGIGKTCIVTYLLRDLKQFILNKKRNLKICYCNCKDKNSQTNVVSSVVRELSSNEVPETGLGFGTFVSRLDSGLTNIDGVLVVLDEVNAILPEGETLLYILLRRSKISLVIISNDFIWDQNIQDSRIRSSLDGSEILKFDPYPPGQIKTILHGYAENALYSGTFTGEILEEIADSCDNGDLRRGIQLLKLAAEHAEANGGGKIGAIDVDYATRSLKGRLIDVIERLPLDDQVIITASYLAWKANRYRTITIDEIYNQYKKLFLTSQYFRPKSQEVVRKRIYDFKICGILGHRGGKGRGHGLGRTPARFEPMFDPEVFEEKILPKFKDTHPIFPTVNDLP